MDRRTLFSGALVALLVGGCGKNAAPPYPEWVRKDLPAEGPGVTAYAAYCDAARQAEIDAAKYLDQLDWSHDKRENAKRLLAPALARLVQGTKREAVGFRYVPGDGPSAYYRGWRLLGQALVWRIEANRKAGRTEEAIRDVVAATRFGFDLGNGSALEASLGLTTADQARRAFAPGIARMTAAQLRTLEAGLKTALQRKPDVAVTLENERLAMLAGVQRVQDAFRDRKLGELTKTLGPDVQRAIDYLEGKRAEGENARVKYFEGFAREAETMARYWQALAKQPANARGKDQVPLPELDESRPWKRFARHYFTAARGLLEQNDATLARTRLFALEAALSANVRKNGYAPATLNPFGDRAVDPYSGRPFAYRRDGREFRVYSVGQDARDDGGQTDDTFASPDLTLEAGA